VVKAYIQYVNAKVAKVPGSIPASSDIVESDEAVLYKVHKKEKSKKIPLSIIDIPCPSSVI
jgi:hypothetical protein